MKQIITIENLDLEQLVLLLKDIVNQCLDQHITCSKQIENSKPRKMLNIKEVACLLNKSVATIHSYKRKKLIPYKKINRSLFFDEDEVLNSMRQFKNLKTNDYQIKLNES